MKAFYVRYHDRSYLVRLHESMGLDREPSADEWIILQGRRILAAIPYQDLESQDELEGRVLSVLSTRVK